MRIRNPKLLGHGAGTICAFIWGCTFISTKMLLESFSPGEILFTRFLIGFLLLLILHPAIIPFTSLRQEASYAACGFFGVMLYYLLENLALTHTNASTVSIITSSAPFFTALFAAVLMNEKLSVRFLIGFVVSMTGISLISFVPGEISFGFAGTALCIAASAVWGIYSIALKKTEKYGFGPIEVTQRCFFYGLIFMLPMLHFMNFRWEPARFIQGLNPVNLLFLGVFASAVCFLTWTTAVRYLGAVKASVYIYVMPVITVVVSIPVLHEIPGKRGVLGMVLTLAGVVISEKKNN